MNKIGLAYIISSVAILLAQVLVFKNVELLLFDRYTMACFLYPIIILGLPLSTPRSVLLILAFIVGLLVDLFYDSPGVHAGALVFTAYARSFVLGLIEPRGGYRIDNRLTIAQYGLNWFLLYLFTTLFLHIFIYFSLDAFTFVYFSKILINTIISCGISYVLLVVYQSVVR